MNAESTTHAVMDYTATKQMWKLTPSLEEVQLLVNQDLIGMIKIQ